MAETNYNNVPINSSQEEESDIDIMELVSKLWKRRNLIIKWCICGAVFGLVVAFSLPKTYNASVVLAPETDQKVGSGVSSIASMMGVSLDNNNDAINFMMFPDVISSTPFIFELLDLPVQFERGDSTVNTDLLDYMLNYQKAPWWSAVLGAPGKAIGWVTSLFKEEEEENAGGDGELNIYNLPKKERDIVKALSGLIKVNVDKKTGKTDMSLSMQDPLVVASVMNAVVDNLKDYMANYRTSKASQDVENLSDICNKRKADYYEAQQAYAKHVDGNKNVSLLSAQVERERLQQEMNLAYQVYSQVATQLEAARIKEQKDKPVVAVVEPPVVPLKHSAPSKAKMLIVFTFLAGCISSAWVLWGEEYLQKFKEVFKDKV